MRKGSLAELAIYIAKVLALYAVVYFVLSTLLVFVLDFRV